MNCYETLFVVKPTLTEEEIAATITKIQNILTKEDAEIVGTNDIGMRKLGYPVEKHDRGYYAVLYYKAEGTIINELERNLRISEDVIKFLSVKYSNTKEMAQFNKLVAATNKTEPAKAEPVEATPIKVEETVKVEPVEATPIKVEETVKVTESTQA